MNRGISLVTAVCVPHLELRCMFAAKSTDDAYRGRDRNSLGESPSFSRNTLLK